MSGDMDWTAARIAELRDLWAQGHAGAAIGRRMGISKSAVVGKAHRLNLPPRPSPIRRGGVVQPARPRALLKGAATLPPLAAAAPAKVAPPPPVAKLAALPRPVPIAAAVQAVVERMPAAVRHAVAAADGARDAAPKCCWPIGEPRTPFFHFCDAPAQPHKPYCPAHWLRAWRPGRAATA